MFFVGRHLRQLDKKSRLAIPAEYLNRFSQKDRGEVYLTPGKRGCIWLVPKSYWEKEFLRFEAAYRSDVPDEFYHHCQSRPIDKSGRVLLDGQLRALARLPDPATHESVGVMVCGSGRYLQIWHNERYEEMARSPSEFAASIPVGGDEQE